MLYHHVAVTDQRRIDWGGSGGGVSNCLQLVHSRVELNGSPYWKTLKSMEIKKEERDEQNLFLA